VGRENKPKDWTLLNGIMNHIQERLLTSNGGFNPAMAANGRKD
jgi:hypothetical protein